MSLGSTPNSAEKAVSSLLLMLRLTTISVVRMARAALYYSALFGYKSFLYHKTCDSMFAQNKMPRRAQAQSKTNGSP